MNVTSQLKTRALAALVFSCSAVASAQERPAGYPAKPIRLVVSVAPGAGGDTMARAVGRIISDAWKADIVVDNRPGAGGAIASELVAKSTPDGYTFISQGSSLLIQGATKRVSFHPLKAFDPVVPTSMQPYILLAHPNLPVKSIKELIAHSAKHKVTYSGSSGVGSMPHIGLSRFAKLSGAKLHFIPYKGSAPAIIALMGGEIHMAATSSIAATGAIRTGKVRGLANLGPTRVAALPDLPTVAEQGFPGFSVTNRYGLQAPAGTPRPILAAINRIVGEAMHNPEIIKFLASAGSEPNVRMTPDEYRAAMTREYAEIEEQVKQLDLSAIIK
jgi:tripartite-type tricarboxylate transporter receptor subunit TctC